MKSLRIRSVLYFNLHIKTHISWVHNLKLLLIPLWQVPLQPRTYYLTRNPIVVSICQPDVGAFGAAVASKAPRVLRRPRLLLSI